MKHIFEIAQGNLEVEIDSRKGDYEIRELAESFDNMRVSLKVVKEMD